MQSAAITAKDSTTSQQQALSCPSNRRFVQAPVVVGKRAILLVSVLQNRRLASLLLLAAALQAGLAAAGQAAWACPFKAFFSIPCPGCGLTTGVVHLMHGQWESALHAHLFSPVLIVGAAAAGLVTLMPASTRRTAINRVEVLEKRAGVSMWIGVCFCVYWIWRLAVGT